MDEKKVKGEIIAQGKTKKIYAIKGNPDRVIIENQNEITKNDDKSLTQKMASKAEYATATTCNVFQLLKEAGIPVAFERQISPTEFLAPKCKMIPLEVIIRRYAVGSYLKRFPDLEVAEGEVPFFFDELVFEVFLKTTDGKFTDNDGLSIAIDSDVQSDDGKPVDDPLIANPYDLSWDLKHPKIPYEDEDSDLSIFEAESGNILRNLIPGIMSNSVLPDGIAIEHIEEIARKVFLKLENAWAQQGCRLIDFKIEFGSSTNGELLVADVIDNDSWRLRTADWKELSKQLFRDNYPMEEISEKYALVAKLVEKFSLPK